MFGNHLNTAMRCSRVWCKYQWCVVGNNRTVLQVPFVCVHVVGTPFETTTRERAQVSSQSLFARHEVQSHFEFLFEFFLRIPNEFVIWVFCRILNNTLLIVIFQLTTREHIRYKILIKY